MKKILCTTLLLTLIACDTPQRTRTPSIVPLTQDQGDTAQVTDDSSTDDTTTDTGDDSSQDDTTNSQTAGFENCNLNYQHYARDAGRLGLCQSTLDERKFKLKMELTDSSSGTCFVPVNIQSTGTSFKLGIAECVRNQSGKEYDMILTKDRSEPINGVMVIKATALNAYMQCMSAKADFINAYAPNCMYDSKCLSAADSYALSICTQFSQTYRNYYEQIPL